MHVEVFVATSIVESELMADSSYVWHGISFANVCRSKGENKRGTISYIENEQVIMDELIEYVTLNPETNTCTSCNGNRWKQYEFHSSHVQNQDKARTYPPRCCKFRIYHDNWATISLDGSEQLRHIGLSERNMIPSKMGSCSGRILLGMSRLATSNVHKEKDYKTGMMSM